MSRFALFIGLSSSKCIVTDDLRGTYFFPLSLDYDSEFREGVYIKRKYLIIYTMRMRVYLEHSVFTHRISILPTCPIVYLASVPKVAKRFESPKRGQSPTMYAKGRKRDTGTGS